MQREARQKVQGNYDESNDHSCPVNTTTMNIIALLHKKAGSHQETGHVAVMYQGAL